MHYKLNYNLFVNTHVLRIIKTNDSELRGQEEVAVYDEYIYM